MHDAFLGSPALITRKVLSNEITTDVLPEAFAVFETATRKEIPGDNHDGNRPQEDISDTEQVLLRHAKKRQPPPRELNLAQASWMSDMHRHVRYFAADFAAEALTNLQNSPYAANSPPAPANQADISRIERAFYRFELFCNTYKPRRLRFGNRSAVSRNMQLRVANKYTPWENEQLACISDYLIRKITIPWNHMVKHDISWAGKWADHNQLSLLLDNSMWMGFIMAQGLFFIHKLCEARTHWEISALIRDRQDICPQALDHILDRCRHQKSLESYISPAVLISNFTPE
ncbi:hypothetical protein B0J14DRAFT_156039 [Halenospora varia]|nr:hypothetical protein B0J14DRAFT_156039 [Halenospora varia]